VGFFISKTVSIGISNVLFLFIKTSWGFMNNITDNKNISSLDSDIEHIQEMIVYQESKAYEFKKYVSGLYIDVFDQKQFVKRVDAIFKEVFKNMD